VCFALRQNSWDQNYQIAQQNNERRAHSESAGLRQGQIVGKCFILQHWNANGLLITTCQCGVIMFSVASACLSVCLSVMLSLSFDLESSLLVSSQYLRQVYIPRSSGQGRSHRNQKRICVSYVRGWSAFDWKAFLFTVGYGQWRY